MITAIVLVIAAVVILVIAFGDSRDPTTPGISESADAPPLPDDLTQAVGVSSVTPFDPQGTGPPGENDELASLTLDGDPDTLWRSERYRARTFGLKDGIGLQIDVEPDSLLGQLEIDSPTQAWSGDVHVFERSTEVAGFDPDADVPITSLSEVQGDARVPLEGVRGGSILVWVTDLGEGPEQYRFDVSEIRVLGGP